jgi:hypothetical protein
MIRPMATELTSTQTEQNMKDSGKKTNRTDKERKLGLMEPATLENTNKERSPDTGNSNGQMAQNMKAISSKIISTEKVTQLYDSKGSTHGLTKGNLWATGKTTKWTAKVPLSGLMEENTLVNTKTTKRKAMEYSSGKLTKLN